jgi:hypothetical protein
MRRRRKPLEVSTFPFLAVLLCTMGSLILVLLVMDRKAKMGARLKAETAVARAADDVEQAAAERRAELERHMQEKRAEWEKKREALHTKLLTEQQALQLEMQQLRDKMTLAAARLRLEQEQSGELKKQVEAGRGKVQGEATALTRTKQTLADTQQHTEQEKAALARMTNDLVVLERALQDLKETREREKQTYSVIPYNGKRGESRRPMYIECAGESAVFHPDKKAVLVREPEGVRTEVARRVARQREQLAAAKMPVDQTPYLMLLVRPNGIYAYYAFEAALAGLDVQFGYELIDADWLLDFPAENQPGTQPWQALAKQPDPSPLNPAPTSDAKVRGVQFHKGAIMQPVVSGQGDSEAANSGVSGSQVAASGGMGTRSDNPVSPGGLAQGQAPSSWDGVANRPAHPDGLQNRPTNRPTETGLGQPVAVGGGPQAPGGAHPGSGANSPGTPTTPGKTLASGSAAPSPTSQRGNRSNNSDSLPPFLAQGGARPPVPTSGVRPGDTRGPGEAGPQLPPLPTAAAQSGPAAPPQPGSNPGTGVPPGNGQPGSGAPGDGSTPTNGQRAASGDQEGGNPDGSTRSVLRPLQPLAAEAKRPPPMRSARLNGDRDYLIFIECKADSVVLYPSQREFALSSLTGGANHPLVQAVQQMIERKQSGVRSGELPYRPQIRFLVRPETLRAYHSAYPLVDALPIMKTRQNLIPEDDVRSIIAGN